MQRLIIKNFGPIKDLDLDIQDFMVFIGPQASGKSTIAKVVYFFKELPNKLAFQIRVSDFNGFLKGETIDRVKYLIETTLDIIFNQNEVYKNDDFLLSYEYAKGRLLVITNKKVVLSGFDEYLSIITKIRNNYTHKTHKDNNELSRGEKWDFIQKAKAELDAVFNEMFDYENRIFFIPAGRMNVIQKENGDFLERIFTNSLFLLRGNEKNIHNNQIDFLERKILKGSYVFIDEDDENEGKDKLNIGNYQLLLKDASSGQQEAVWIIQLVKFLISEIRSYLSIIEEPEAHLYPEAQRDIVNLIALLANTNQNQILITTHSPYILAAINNLLYAHQVGQKHPEKVAEKIDKNLWLDVKRLGVYFVDNGKTENIIDEETGMIDNLYLDSSVTKLLNEDLETLLNLEN